MQPVSLEDDVTEGGGRVSERLKVYVPEVDVLRAAFDTGKRADRVRWFNREYKVERSEAWGKYTQAVLFRET